MSENAIRAISDDDYADRAETNLLVQSADSFVYWQGQATGGAAPGLTNLWEAQSITVETANAGYGNGNCAQVAAPLSASRQRMAAVDALGRFSTGRVYFDVVIDTLPAAGQDVFAVGLRLSGDAGTENGYVFTWKNGTTPTVGFYRHNAGTESEVATQDGTAPLADTAYVIAVEAVNSGADVILRASIWAAKSASEPAVWQTEFTDTGGSVIQSIGWAGWGAPSNVAVQLRSACLNPCLNMWDVTDVDVISEARGTTDAQTLYTDVSGAYGWLEVQNPDYDTTEGRTEWSDNFNRANETIDANANWSYAYRDNGGDNIHVRGNQLEVDTGDAISDVCAVYAGTGGATYCEFEYVRGMVGISLLTRDATDYGYRFNFYIYSGINLDQWGWQNENGSTRNELSNVIPGQTMAMEVFDSGIVKLYVDGTEVDSYTDPNPVPIESDRLAGVFWEPNTLGVPYQIDNFVARKYDERSPLTMRLTTPSQTYDRPFELGQAPVIRVSETVGIAIPKGSRNKTTTAEVRKQQPGGGGGASNAGGGQVIVDLPPQAGTFDLTCHIEGYDFGSGKWYTILSGANITAGATNQRLQVSPFVNDVANSSANDVLPYLWRVRVEHGDATECTYSVAYNLS